MFFFFTARKSILNTLNLRQIVFLALRRRGGVSEVWPAAAQPSARRVRRGEWTAAG